LPLTFARAFSNTQVSPQAKPALRNEAERMASALPPLLIAAERLAQTVQLGVHGRRKSGMGENFWQFRRYRAEDPSTAIDWRQSAKSPHLFVREREWEAAETVRFWRDDSEGMRFASTPAWPHKSERAALLILALASLLMRGGERIGLLGETRQPSSGRAALNHIAYALCEAREAAAPLPPSAQMTRNGQLVWASDFLSPLPELETAMRRFAQSGAQGHLLHIADPAEEDFPFTGRTRFELPGLRDTETLGRAESARGEYRDRFRAHAESVSAMARRLGWTYLRHRTDQRPEMALIALYATLAGPRARLHG
jgi:uncharacterized protein (DUF58 family)